MNITKKINVITAMSICMCIASTASDKGYTVISGKGGSKESIGKEVTYEAIEGQITHTFATEIEFPSQKQLFDTNTIHTTNQYVFDFITKKNKSLGFKNSDIDTISNQLYNITESLINIIKLMRGALSKSNAFVDTDSSNIIAQLTNIVNNCVAQGEKIEKVLNKKFPPITETSKKLLSLMLTYSKALISFTAKLQSAVYSTRTIKG